MQSVFCTFEYKMKAGHFVRSFFVWVRGLFAAVDGSVVMSVKQCGRLRAKCGKLEFARKFPNTLHVHPALAEFSKK